MLPPLSGRPIRVELRRSLGAHLAATHIPKRLILLDSELLTKRGEFERILVHEIFHFAWVRLSNQTRRSWEDILAKEFGARARGELGWSSEWRKDKLDKLKQSDIRRRVPGWRRYVCESFCDTSAWLYAGLRVHDEYTLASGAAGAAERGLQSTCLGPFRYRYNGAMQAHKLSVSSIRRWTLFAAALIILASCESPIPDNFHVKAVKERKPTPDFNLKDATGANVKLSDYKGKVVLLNFWATWCGPCKVEIPWFMDFQKTYKDRDFAVIGVSMDEDGWDAVKPYVEEKKMNYQVVLGNDQVSQLFGSVDSLPTTIVIDREGRIASMHIGLVAKATYQKEIEQLLEASKDGPKTGAVRVPGGEFAWLRSK